MGGETSGRHRTVNAGRVEDGLRLDMRLLRRRGYLVPETIVSGNVGWKRRDVSSGAVCLRLDLQVAHGLLTISYCRAGEVHLEEVRVVSTPCRYGGRRYYFICPQSGARCELLISIHGGPFVSRKAARLTYATQSEDRLARLQTARLKAEKRAFGRGELPKPRGARAQRLRSRWIDLEAAAEGLFLSEADRRFGDLAQEWPR